jgi:hypothetical protein
MDAFVFCFPSLPRHTLLEDRQEQHFRWRPPRATLQSVVSVSEYFWRLSVGRRWEIILRINLLLGAFKREECWCAVGYGSFTPPCVNVCCCLWPCCICCPTCCTQCGPRPPRGPLWDPVDKKRWNKLLREAEGIAKSKNCICADPHRMRDSLERDWLDKANQFLSVYDLRAEIAVWVTKNNDGDVYHIAIKILKGAIVNVQAVPQVGTVEIER